MQRTSQGYDPPCTLERRLPDLLPDRCRVFKTACYQPGRRRLIRSCGSWWSARTKHWSGGWPARSRRCSKLVRR